MSCVDEEEDDQEPVGVYCVDDDEDEEDEVDANVSILLIFISSKCRQGGNLSINLITSSISIPCAVQRS